METNLTVEQAINNVAIAIEQFKGTKAEHITLEHSVKVIKNEIERLKFIDEQKAQPTNG